MHVSTLDSIIRKYHGLNRKTWGLNLMWPEFDYSLKLPQAMQKQNIEPTCCNTVAIMFRCCVPCCQKLPLSHWKNISKNHFGQAGWWLTCTILENHRFERDDHEEWCAWNTPHLKHEKATHHFKLREEAYYPNPWNTMVYTPTNIAPQKLTSRKKHCLPTIISQERTAKLREFFIISTGSWFPS